MVAKNQESTSLAVQSQNEDKSQTRTQQKPKIEEFQPPFWLKKAALLLFTFFFIACGAALVVLDRVITAQNGIPLTISTTTYSWTYGPTAILIVILSLWRRHDYHAKAVQPWCELQAGKATASRSVLLDYIAPFQAMSLLRAIKNRHFVVASTIASFFIIKLIILTSTTLFVLRETSIEGKFNIAYQDKIEDDGLWKQYNISEKISSGWPEGHFPAFDGGSSDPIWAYLASLNNMTSNETGWQPAGGLTTQSFKLVTNGHNITEITAPVEVFTPKITCEYAKLEALVNKRYQRMNPYGNRDFHFASETCIGIGEEEVDVCLPKLNDPPTEGYRACVDDPFAYTVHRINCSAGSSDDSNRPQLQDWLAKNKPFDIRYAITAARFKSSWFNDTAKGLVHVVNMTTSNAIVCKLGYAIETLDATLEVISGSVTFPKAPIKSTTLGNLSDLAFAEMLWANFKKPADSLVTSDKIPTRLPARPNLRTSPPAPEAVFFQLMYAQLGYPEDLIIFDSPSVLANSSITILEAVARNMALQSLLVPKEEQAIAGGFRTEGRLFMRPVAVWTIVGLFTLLAIICLLLLCMTRPFKWSPTMAGSLASHASILVNSPDFQKVLADNGHLPQDGLKKKSQSSKILLPRQDSSSGELSKANEQKQPWIPLAVRLPLISITFIAPLICIGVLELLYCILRDKEHFVVIGTQDSDTLSYVIRLASTLTVFGVATMINNLDFTILTFAPYSNLRATSASAKRSLLFHPLSMNPFLILFKTALNGQIGVASSNAATIIAGFLTIIVSGLWIAVQSPIVNQHALALVRNWDLDWFSDYRQDNGATLELNLIRNRGAATPSSIWNELVVPKISLQGDFTDAAYRDANYVFDVIALQPIINCSVLPQEAISSLHWSFADEPGAISDYAPPDGAMVTISPPRIPQTCSVSNYEGFADLRINITYHTHDSLNKVWVAKYIDLANSTAGQVEVDCPSIAMFFGYFNKTEPSEKNITGLVCTQGINQVPVSIRYRGDPTLGHITSVMKRGKCEPVRNITTDSETLGYELEPFLASQLLNFEKNDTEYQYDPFFDQLLHHSNRYPTDTLLGPSNTDNLIDAVTKDYCELMRHIINRNLRSGSDRSRYILDVSEQTSTAAQSTVTGLYSAEVTHLVIDSTSKLVLQILLGTMTGLSFIGFLLVKIRRTLPRDPCTIASTMSLLAGSELCDPGSQVFPSGAERMSVEEMTLALEGWVFSLGWWHSHVPNDGSCTEADSRASHVDPSAREITEMDERKMRFGIDIGKPDSSVLS